MQFESLYAAPPHIFDALLPLAYLIIYVFLKLLCFIFFHQYMYLFSQIAFMGKQILNEICMSKNLAKPLSWRTLAGFTYVLVEIGICQIPVNLWSVVLVDNHSSINLPDVFQTVKIFIECYQFFHFRLFLLHFIIYLYQV